MTAIPNSISIETFLASQTQLARREIFQLLKDKKIEVNGHIVHSISHLVKPKIDVIKVDKKRIVFNTPFVYYKFHKPRNVISTLADPKGRVDLSRFIKSVPNSIFPVGRLDRNTKGLLLFTNDGSFSHRISHPKFKVSKTYEVVLDKPISKDELKRLTSGFFLDDGPVQFDSIERYSETELKVVISEGRNRIIRRSFAFFGYTVIRLFRLSIGPISLGTVKEGKFKALSQREFRDISKLISDIDLD